MKKKATSMNLTVDALHLLDELAALYGVPKTRVMEIAVRELYDRRVGRQWYQEDETGMVNSPSPMRDKY